MPPTFSTPEEEIKYLRSQIEKKTEDSKGFEHRISPEDNAHAVIREHAATPIEQSVHPSMSMPTSHTERLLAYLAPKETDAQVKMLAQVMADKGIRNAIEVARKAKDPELEDDFHRYLVQYLLYMQEGESDVSKEEWKALHMVLYEVALPNVKQDDGKGVKEVVGLMEQWYASMQALSLDPTNKEKNYYSLEIALPNGSNSISFYCAIHKEYTDLFEKILVGVFPEAKATACKEDYSIFAHSSAVAAAYATAFTHPALPVKTFKEMEADPMPVLLSSFTKLKKDGEGMALQFLIRPTSDFFVKNYTEMLNDLRKGETLKRVIEKQDLLKETLHITGEIFSSLFASSKTPEQKEQEEKKQTLHTDEVAMKEIQKKLESTIVETNLRVIASAETQERAESILHSFEATFKQFTEANGNSLIFHKMEGRALNTFIHNFSYRLFDNDQSLPLNITETSTIYHFPLYVKELGQLKNVEAVELEAPFDLLPDGIILGYNTYRGGTTDVHFPKMDRMRHMYTIGQTGTGKTNFLKSLIIQDIQNGDGCCFIDPHGTDILDILANIPPERMDDVIYFDPGYIPRPMGLNMLEYDRNFPEQKTFVVNELIGIFNTLFDMKTAGGPGFEQYFRNATLLVMEHPESGNTLLEISRVFSDKDFRDYKLSKCKNPLILQFWQNAEKTTGEQGLQNWTQYITGKFDIFMSNDIMRPIVAQEKSAFNFREIMDTKKILLVNLSKGRLGEINSRLLGLILVGKLSQAALSRVNGANFPEFYLYIDEFQNVTTPAIASILSEARKYKLSLTLAHQYISQLPEDIKGAVFGNVGSMVSFRIGAEDATFLEKQFAPEVTVADLIKVPNYHAYIKMLSGGEPKRPFSIGSYPVPKGDSRMIEPVKEMSYLKYGKPEAEVNEAILRKFQL